MRSTDCSFLRMILSNWLMLSPASFVTMLFARTSADEAWIRFMVNTASGSLRPISMRS